MLLWLFFSVFFCCCVVVVNELRMTTRLLFGLLGLRKITVNVVRFLEAGNVRWLCPRVEPESGRRSPEAKQNKKNISANEGVAFLNRRGPSVHTATMWECVCVCVPTRDLLLSCVLRHLTDDFLVFCARFLPCVQALTARSPSVTHSPFSNTTRPPSPYPRARLATDRP